MSLAYSFLNYYVVVCLLFIAVFDGVMMLILINETWYSHQRASIMVEASSFLSVGGCRSMRSGG